MIGSLRNFAKTKLAGLLVVIMIIPFVFWGMGSMFSGGNTNNIAKINKTNISTQEFIDYLNKSGIPNETIKNNLDKNILEELLSGLISNKIMDLEIEDFNIIISQNSLSQKIKENKNFHDENGKFQRIKYEKFLLENNQSAPGFEQQLKKREQQKNLFDYIGAGTVTPIFLANKLFEEENKKLEIDYIDLSLFYKKKDNYSNNELNNFIFENKDNLKIDYLDFNYVILNPQNLIGVKEFDQTFFDKIDQIEIDISNEIDFNTIVSNLNLEPIKIKNFKFSIDKNEIEKKIFELRNNNFDIFEINDDYILYKVVNIEQKTPDLNDSQTKKEILELIFQKDKFDYNKKLLEKISNNDFNDSDFLKFGQNQIKTTRLNSIKDNRQFEINSVEILYSMPESSFTLISNDKNEVFLAKVKKYLNNSKINDDDQLKEYLVKENSNTKKTILKSYDFFLNQKYNVVLNQQTIERVKNFFQ